MTQTIPPAANTDLEARLMARFARCGLDDPLLRRMYDLAQNWPVQTGMHGTGSHAADLSSKTLPGADFTLAEAEMRQALTRLPHLDVAGLLRDDPQLPPLPQVLEELREITANDRADLEAIGAVVRKDAGLSAFLLRMVNSAFYSFSAKVDTISRAVGIIGVKPLYSLALGFVFSEIISRVPKNMPCLAGLWKHSLAVGIAAQAIWEAQEGREGSERLFVAGLLHDVGKLTLMCVAPEQARLLYGQGAAHTVMHELEDELLGFNHAKLGGLLLKKWNMPAPLVAATHWHHNPQHAAHYKEPLIINQADMLAVALGLGMQSDSPVPPPAWHGAVSYAVTPEALERATEALATRLEDIHAAFGV